MESTSVRHAVVESIDENNKIRGLNVEMVPNFAQNCGGYVPDATGAPSTRECVQLTADSLLAPVLASIVAVWRVIRLGTGSSA